jgi:hypothetical protein
VKQEKEEVHAHSLFFLWTKLTYIVLHAVFTFPLTKVFILIEKQFSFIFLKFKNIKNHLFVSGTTKTACKFCLFFLLSKQIQYLIIGFNLSHLIYFFHMSTIYAINRYKRSFCKWSKAALQNLSPDLLPKMHREKDLIECYVINNGWIYVQQFHAPLSNA